MSRRPDSDPEVERGKRIIETMQRLEREKRKPRVGSWLPWFIVLALLLGIAVVLFAGRERFGLVWRHLMSPDSLPTP